MTARVLPCGPLALLVEVTDAAEVAQLHDWLRRGPPPGVRAIVPAARTVLVEVDEPQQLDEVRTAVAAFAPTEHAGIVAVGDEVSIPTVYDGEDLVWVADQCGLSVEEVVRRHVAPTYVAAFCGFSPGYAYLIGGDPVLRLPRRTEPRTRVPAGAVAIAGEFSAVYPSASPGGWHLLGRALVTVWDVEREPPALIVPGSRVRFVAASREVS